MSEMSELPEVLPAPSAPAVRRRPVSPWVAALAGVVVGAGGVGAAWAASSGGGSSSGSSFTLRGSLTLAFTGVLPVDTNRTGCTGEGGFADIGKGTEVTVYDATGVVVGSGSLAAGRFASSDSVAPCVFRFAVPGVVGGSKFYGVEIAHRGKLTVSAAEAKAGTYAASLG